MEKRVKYTKKYKVEWETLRGKTRVVATQKAGRQERPLRGGDLCAQPWKEGGVVD